jgi:hypothetical protein
MVAENSSSDPRSADPIVRASDPEGVASASTSREVTFLLAQIEAGDPHAAEKLLPLVYEELRKVAATKMAQEKP